MINHHPKAIVRFLPRVVGLSRSSVQVATLTRRVSIGYYPVGGSYQCSMLMISGGRIIRRWTSNGGRIFDRVEENFVFPIRSTTDLPPPKKVRPPVDRQNNATRTLKGPLPCPSPAQIEGKNRPIDSAFIGFPPGKFKQLSLVVVTTGKSAMVTESVQIRAP